MKFPERSTTHKIEAASWRLLQELAPEEWIVREVSERDYGVDAYIEVTKPTGEVTGNLISIQLKAKDELEWMEQEAGIRTARSPSIKTKTANYWLHLPVPVFLFVADLTSKKIYYVSVEEEIRSQFNNLANQDSISFKLTNEIHIQSKIGSTLFPWFIARERAHPQFVFHITNLLSHIEPFGEFIIYNQNRDSFMEVDSERHLQLRALYESIQMVSWYLNKEWKIESLQELYILDRTQWKDDFIYLHEGTLDYVLRKLESIFPQLVRKSLRLVSDTQAAYWRWRDPVFYRLCSNGELDSSITHLEQVIGT
jgi:hypothetical protein